MSFFKLVITGGDNNIEMTTQINSAEVLLDTINDNVMTKSNGMLAKLTITGKIKEEDSAPYLELFRWAKDFKSKTQYRKVELSIFGAEDEGGKYRRYEFGQMFIVDYKETYPENKSGVAQTGTFELKLTQKDDNWDSVESFPK